MAKDVKHFFKCSQPFVFPILRIFCLDVCPILKKLDYLLFISSFLCSLNIFDISLLLDMGLGENLFHSVGCCFVKLGLLSYRSFSVSRGPIYYFLILMPMLSVFCSGSCTFCQCIQGYSSLCLLSGSVYVVLC